MVQLLLSGKGRDLMLTPERITDLTEAEELESGYYVLVDSPTLGTRKIAVEKFKPEEVYFANFTGNGHIQLPFEVQTNYEYIVDFYVEDQYFPQQRAVVGSNSSDSVAFRIFNRTWQYYADGFLTISPTPLYDTRHIYSVSYKNGSIFDGVFLHENKFSYSPSNIWVGGRNGSWDFIGRIYEYKIINTDTDEVVCDIIPMKYNDELVFRDVINGINYTCNGMTVEKE